MYWIKRYFTEPATHLRAFAEVMIVFAFSLSPFIITAFVRSAKLGTGAMANISDLFSRGQIYLLAYALFGNLFWLAFVRWDKPRHDARIFLGTVSVFLVIPIIGFIGVDPTFSTVVNDSVVSMGYWFYGAFLLLHYLLLFYSDITPPDPNEIFEREATSMASRYEAMSHGE